MKNMKKLLLSVIVLTMGIRLIAANPYEVLRKARADYYKEQADVIKAKKEEERLEKLKKKEEEKAEREAKLAEQRKQSEEARIERERIRAER